MADKRLKAKQGDDILRIMTDPGKEHHARILDQFTRQAEPFALAPAHSTEESLQLFLDTVQVAADDIALDVACGPGIISCALAARAQQVTGIDLVPAMIEQANKRQREKELNNIQWLIGNAEQLPFADNSFSLVVTRYSFHHLLHPELVLAEMKRVCRPGGRVAVADVTPEAEKIERYDELETLRDPSHAKTLSPDQLKRLGEDLKLNFLRNASFGLSTALEDLLRASFPPPGNAEKYRQKVADDIGKNLLSINAYREGNEIQLRLPISIVVWTKPRV